MWGYDRSEDTMLVPYKTQDEHFELFCMVLERGFAIHTCHSDRLVVEFRLKDTGSRRYLPRVHPKGGVSFRIPEEWLKPSDLYLHYDPSSEADIPELAYFRPESNTFIPFDYENASLLDPNEDDLVIPVVKLSTLKGLHYIKDIACLQMFKLDFNRLSSADPALAEQVREVLARKMERFVEFAHPWVQANYAERIAKDYLENYKPSPLPKSAGRKASILTRGKLSGVKKRDQSVLGNSPDSTFLSWD